ncbi:MAG TPA: hypothetical protein VFR81_22090, partial [Longimicrobium sp.]|nr:hypothetical protein [Longimicrobium sp.]
RVTGVPVGAGESPRVVVTVTAAAQADRVETSAYAAGVRGGFGAPGRLRFSAADLAALPAERRELGTVLSFSPLLPPPDPATGGIGRAWVVDGVPFTTVRLPSGVADPLSLAALSFRSLERAELLAAPADAEWSGAGGAFLHALTRRGTGRFAAGAEGSWAGGSLGSDDGFPSASVSHSAIEGSAWAGGPLGAGGGTFAFGADVRSRETPLQLGTRAGDLAAALVAVARDSFGVGLQGAPEVVRTDVGSAFFRVDAPLGGGHSLSVRAAGATLVSPERREPTVLSGGGGEARGRDLLASATLSSPLGWGTAVEARLGVEHSQRDFASADSAFGLTRVLSGALGFGGHEAFPGRFSRTGLTGSAAVHAPMGAHRFKAGAGAAYVSHDRAYAPGAAGEFTFSDADDFAGGRGVYAQTLGASSSVSFTVPRIFAFAQDTWTPAPGVALTVGARYDMEKLPTADIPLDVDWGVRTGMVTANVRPSASRVSPRASLVVEPAGGGWRFRAEGGLYTGESDPALLAEALGSGAALRVRQGLDVPWRFNGAPDSASVSRVARTLTLLTTEWAPPRDARAGASLSRALPGGAAAHLSAEWRRSDFLPRRADLNLAPEPGGRDQFGRPLFGTLVQRGGLLLAEPGTNRRFADFDRVSAANLDGWLERTAVTVSVERAPATGLRLLAGYTWSRTRDNLPGVFSLSPGGVPTPFLVEGADWSEGTSDADVPHRAVAIAELRAGGSRAPALALVYRVRSGDAFTPGFRAGVDANADGSGANDPAFVDASVPGFAEVAAEWGCLDALSGAFAERNACRGPTVHALDARLGIDLLPGAHPLRLTIDGLNLLGGEPGPRDAALYLVDPSRALSTDAEGRVVVPLLANPGFGEPLLRRATGRTLRIGLQLAY